MHKTKDPVRVAVGRIGRRSGPGGWSEEALINAYRDLRVAHIERAITIALTTEPLPTPEQTARLAAMLTGGSSK